jgi:GT2 family glycosyltransferase
MSEIMPKVTAVTPVHNGKDHTMKFLESLKNQTYRNFNIIITDDGSSDGTAEAIKRKYPDVTVLHGNGELWWSGATNLGVEAALDQGSDYVFTVNNDVVLDRGVLKNLVKEAQRYPKTLVGSMVCDIKEPERVWYFGGYFNKSSGDLNHVTGRSPEFKTSRQAEWLTGMGVLIPKEAYTDAGLYDQDNFPQY